MKAQTNERGQTIAITVFCLVALVGMCALVLDVGAWFRTKRSLQATADASALAGAQALPQDASSARSLALTYAGKNGGNVSSGDVEITSLNGPDDTIRVTARKTDTGIFSRVLGVVSVPIKASARARTDVPGGVRYVAPMVVSCEHEWIQNCHNNGRLPDFNRETDLDFSKMGAPGAFGMLNLNKGNGTPGTSDEAGWILRGFSGVLYPGDYRSDPGAKFSSQELQSALDTRLSPDSPPLLFPVFEKDLSLVDGGGQVTTYRIIGWIAFKLTSYEVHGNDATLHGYFTDYIADGILSPGGPGSPNYGVRSIQLIE
jgi:Putative Flp pilus-assembly TadE/G-like